MNITSYIQFDGDNLDTAEGAGLISTIDRDMDIKVVPFASDNERLRRTASPPSHRAAMTSRSAASGRKITRTASRTTPSRSASFATTPISAGSPARTTPRSTNS